MIFKLEMYMLMSRIKIVLKVSESTVKKVGNLKNVKVSTKDRKNTSVAKLFGTRIGCYLRFRNDILCKFTGEIEDLMLVELVKKDFALKTFSDVCISKNRCSSSYDFYHYIVLLLSNFKMCSK